MTSLPSARLTALRRREQHPNLLGAWGFDEGTGTIARDSSEHNASLTVSPSLAWVAGHSAGTAISNTGGGGSSAYTTWTVSVPITIMGWARPTDLTPGSTRPLFGIWDTSDFSGSTQCAISAQRGDFGTPNVLQGNVRVNGGLVEIAHTALTVNTWYHLALSYDGTTIRLFRDGSEVATVSITGTIFSAAYFFAVVPGPTNAQVDDARVFNAALTAAQVAAFMGDPVAP